MTEDDRRAYDFIASLRCTYHDYHHKKEQAAYAVGVLYLGVAGGIIVNPAWRDHDQEFFLGLWAATSFFAISFVWWQLKQRREAAKLVSATTTVMADWIHRAPELSQYTPTRVGKERWPLALASELQTFGCAFWWPVILTLAPLVVAAFGVGYLIFVSC